jgi:predicted nucleotidyltransferase component of viral defense system
MIKNDVQLKALVHNRTKGNSIKAQTLLRNYFMERFLERVSKSEYQNKIILKGGILITSIIGIDNRSTMDIDVTLKNLILDEESVRSIVNEILLIPTSDNVKFEITSSSLIQEGFEYFGIRISLMCTMNRMRTPIKIDFTTGDLITPHEIEYCINTMFNHEKINILAYSIETILAEKFETIISRGTLNTRIRDFYDIYMLINQKDAKYLQNFPRALVNTCTNRGTIKQVNAWMNILNEIKQDMNMKKQWISYQSKFDYARQIEWMSLIDAVMTLGLLFERSNNIVTKELP